MYAPTAVHRLVDAQETANRRSDFGTGFTVSWIDQTPPLQRSASVVTPEWLKLPTAVQTDAEGHDTPFNMLDVAPAGGGAGWIDQVPPLQRSTSVDTTPALFV